MAERGAKMAVLTVPPDWFWGARVITLSRRLGDPAEGSGTSAESAERLVERTGAVAKVASQAARVAEPGHGFGRRGWRGEAGASVWLPTA